MQSAGLNVIGCLSQCVGSVIGFHVLCFEYSDYTNTVVFASLEFFIFTFVFILFTFTSFKTLVLFVLDDFNDYCICEARFKISVQILQYELLESRESSS